MELVKSFDIFETLVARPFAPPQKVFPLVATIVKSDHHLSVDSANFEEGRILAEKKARKRARNNEITIEDIYAEYQSTLQLCQKEIEILISTEIKLEIELCRPILSGRRLLEKARSEGNRIVFVSDMYLPGRALRAILVRTGCWKDGDHLYVSCEVGASKGSGEMFRHVLEAESISPNQLIHVGNHPHADVESPLRLGIGVEPFLQGNLHARESDLATARGFGSVLPGLLAGCSRLARLGNIETAAQHQRVREIAAYAAAPFLSGFVLWILQTAKAQHLKRLYFISRDGFILLKVAKELAPFVDPTIELQYLYGSRQAWHFPASRGIGLESASWVWAWTTSYSVSTVLNRVAVTPEAVASFLEGVGLPPEVWNEPMSQENEFKLKKVFVNPDFKTILRREAEKQRMLLVAYLKQEGFFSEIACAIVDVGWQANLQDSLGIVLEQEGRLAVSGFYVGLNHRGSRKEKGERRTYLYDRRHDPKLKLPIIEPQSCIEAFCSANHGSTVRYASEGGAISAVLQEWDTNLFTTWGLDVLQTTVTEYAAELARVLYWLDELDIDPLLAARSMASTWSKPTLEEAECLGSFPFVEDQLGIGAKPLARSLPWQHFARAIKSQYSKSYRVIWMEGCLRLTPQPRSTLLRVANYIKNASHSVLGARMQSQSQ